MESNMTPKELLSIMSRARALKTTYRHCFTEDDRRESVADHSWRIALMAMLLSGEEEFRSVDMDKVIRMCLIHDLGEAFTGDIPSFSKSQEDTALEDKLFQSWVDSFPEPCRREWKDLLTEMDSMDTVEARVYKAIDKLEAVISHNESDIRTWLPLEYDLQLTYGTENVQFSEYLKGLKTEIDKWTREKISENL
jgi:putative hydrolase of HD superfamily